MKNKKKKIIIVLVAIIILMIAPRASASSVGFGTNPSQVEVGDTFEVFVNMNDAAAWNLHVKTSGPVGDCSIDEADSTPDAKDVSKTFSIVCTATGEGKITLSLSGDITSAANGFIRVGDQKAVTVVAKQVNPSPSPSVSPSPSESPSPSPSTSPTTKPSPNNKDNDSKEKSTNNNVRDITVDGKSATKVDAHNYTITVGNGSSTVTIKALLEDSKAKVTGTGTKDLKIGENEFEIVVTSESGSKNKIKLVIIRKESNSLDNLEEVLQNVSGDEVEITIGNDTKLTSEDLQIIKDSNKKVILNYFNNDNKLEYSWELDGTDLYLYNEFDTTLLDTSPNKDKISELSNNKDGIYVTTAQTGKFPTGTKLKIYVGDKYKDGDKVTIYYYDKETDKLEVVSKELTIENGYVQFRTEKGSDFFISEAEQVKTTGEIENNTNPVFMIILCAIVVGVFGFIIFTISRNRKNNKPVQILPDDSTVEETKEEEKEEDHKEF